MKILKKGKPVDTPCECDECGCQFTYKPGDIKIGDSYISNVPEQFLKRYGGDQYYSEIRHYRYIICPWCGIGVKIDDKSKTQSVETNPYYADLICDEIRG